MRLGRDVAARQSHQPLSRVVRLTPRFAEPVRVDGADRPALIVSPSCNLGARVEHRDVLS
jgi:hypothetical protein